MMSVEHTVLPCGTGIMVLGYTVLPFGTARYHVLPCARYHVLPMWYRYHNLYIICIAMWYRYHVLPCGTCRYHAATGDQQKQQREVILDGRVLSSVASFTITLIICIHIQKMMRYGQSFVISI